MATFRYHSRSRRPRRCIAYNVRRRPPRKAGRAVRPYVAGWRAPLVRSPVAKAAGLRHKRAGQRGARGRPWPLAGMVGQGAGKWQDPEYHKAA